MKSGFVLTPKQMKDVYYDLSVFDENSSQTITGIKLKKYLINRPKNDMFEEKHKEPVLKMYRRWRKKTKLKQKTDFEKDMRRIVQRTWQGKGLPEDYEITLEMALETNKCKPNLPSLQAYADQYLGIDCSGFVNAYFYYKGKIHKGTIDHLESMTISDFYNRTTARQRLRDVQQDDCLVWVDDEGKLKGGRAADGHIMLVQGRTPGADPDGKDDVLQIVEATGPRIKGLQESDYKLTQDKKTKKETETIGKGNNAFEIFHMKRGVSGKGTMWVKIVKSF